MSDKKKVKTILIENSIVKVHSESAPDPFRFTREGFSDKEFEQALDKFKRESIEVENPLLATLHVPKSVNPVSFGKLVDGIYPAPEGLVFEVEKVKVPCPGHGYGNEMACLVNHYDNRALVSFEAYPTACRGCLEGICRTHRDTYESTAIPEVKQESESKPGDKEPSEFKKINDELNRLFPFRVGFSAEHGRKTEELRGAFLAGYEFKKLSNRDEYLIDGFKKAIESERLKGSDYWRGVKDAYQTAIDFVNRKVKPKKS